MDNININCNTHLCYTPTSTPSSSSLPSTFRPLTDNAYTKLHDGMAFHKSDVTPCDRKPKWSVHCGKPKYKTINNKPDCYVKVIISDNHFLVIFGHVFYIVDSFCYIIRVTVILLDIFLDIYTTNIKVNKLPPPWHFLT